MPSFSRAFLKGRERVQRDLVAVWFSVDAHMDSTRNTWEYLQRKGTIPHLVWNPATGEMVFGVPLDHTGTMWPEPYGVTVAVMCDPDKPFTLNPMEGPVFVSQILKALGVPEVWPFGPPGFTEHYRAVRGRLKPGHYSADQIDSSYQGIGAVDIGRLLGA